MKELRQNPNADIPDLSDLTADDDTSTDLIAGSLSDTTYPFTVAPLTQFSQGSQDTTDSTFTPLRTLQYASENRQQYVQDMKNLLQPELEKRGISTSYLPYLIAQTALESGWGTSAISKYNNFGGMTATDSQRGVEATDKECDNQGNCHPKTQRFRIFNSPEDFARYYVDRLQNKFHAFESSPSDFTTTIRKHGYYTAPLS